MPVSRKLWSACALTAAAILLLAATGAQADIAAASAKQGSLSDELPLTDADFSWLPEATTPDANAGKAAKTATKATKKTAKQQQKKPKKKTTAEAGVEDKKEESAVEEPVGERYNFQTEVGRMMKLIINSVYKSKEIFLRELISNASDALDKIRLLSLTDKAALNAGDELKVTIRADHAKQQIVITDTGVGMRQKELRDNLGTLAKSGTAEFVAAMEKANETGDKSAGKAKTSDAAAASATGLIGQFGVGFYSAFLVADRVTVASKHNDEDHQWVWISRADDSGFTIAEDPRGVTLGRGTEITLHLKPELAREYMSEKRLRELVTKYSEFVNFPIYLQTTKTETIEVPIEEKEEKEKKDDSDEAQVEDKESSEEEAAKPKTRTEKRAVPSLELMNTQKPLWTRDPQDVTKEEYASFYRAFTKDNDDPLSQVHFKADAASVDFSAMIFLPKRPPTNYLNKLSDDNALPTSVKLYVRHIFITDELRLLLPRYLTFVRALVDASDLPLNVSRETLQRTRALRLISKKLAQKTLEMLTKMSRDDPDGFKEFQQQYSSNLKLGCIEDTANRGKLMRLLRYHSTHSLKDVKFTRTKSKGVRELEAEQRKNRTVSMADYISRMKKGQKRIYYLAGMSLAEMTHSPFLERLQAKGYEVLFMDEALDEYVLGTITEFEGKRFTNVAKAILAFDDEEDEDTDPNASAMRAAIAQKTREREQTQFKPLTDWLREVLSDHVAQVTISNRLTTSACALVAQDGGLHGNLERVMRAQALSQGNERTAFQLDVGFKKIMELNTQHPLIRALADRVKVTPEAEEELQKSQEDTESKEEKDKKPKSPDGPKRFYTGDDFATKPDEELAFLLFETTQIRSDYDLSDRSAFAERVEKVMRRAVDVDETAKADVDPEFVKPVPEREEKLVIKDIEEEDDKDDGDNEDDETKHVADETEAEEDLPLEKASDDAEEGEDVDHDEL